VGFPGILSAEELGNWLRDQEAMEAILFENTATRGSVGYVQPLYRREMVPNSSLLLPPNNPASVIFPPRDEPILAYVEIQPEFRTSLNERINAATSCDPRCGRSSTTQKLAFRVIGGAPAQPTDIQVHVRFCADYRTARLSSGPLGRVSQWRG
jgi:hypothetical protein